MVSLYDVILAKTFSEMRESLEKVVTIDSVKKMITVEGECCKDAISDKSDIIIYYDVACESRPLLLIERIPKKAVNLRELKKKVSKENQCLACFVLAVSIKKGTPYVDVIVVREAIYNNIK